MRRLMRTLRSGGLVEIAGESLSSAEGVWTFHLRSLGWWMCRQYLALGDYLVGSIQLGWTLSFLCLFICSVERNEQRPHLWNDSRIALREVVVIFAFRARGPREKNMGAVTQRTGFHAASREKYRKMGESDQVRGPTERIVSSRA